MGLNILKLCVGCKSPEELKLWQDTRDEPLCHVTRMWPRREAEIAGLGSLYWVMNGEIRARQGIKGFEERLGNDGIRRCAILLDRKIILTTAAPRRAFQGWRYFESADAPKDIGELGKTVSLPEELERALSDLGVA